MTQPEAAPSAATTEAAALAQRIVDVATKKGHTIATAESCTGGLVAHLLTNVPGASVVFVGGWVPYHDRRKTEDLGVHPDILARSGAVSGQVAETLAQGARKKTGATFAVATTGIAGPGHTGTSKPVGEVWIGVAGPTDVSATKHQFSTRPREAMKTAFAAAALAALWDALVAADSAPDANHTT